MRSATDYDDRQDGYDALPTALGQLMQRIMMDNPLQTLTVGLFHHEYRIYPEIALREGLLNALCHQDFRMPGPVVVAQYPDRLEISNAGGFIGGISPDNILHHRPAPRNPVLVNALVRLRLVNRLNLGVRRMVEAMLIEGKEPPRWSNQGEAVRVTLRRQEISAPFRRFVTEEGQAGRVLGIDHLLVVRYLLDHPEIDTPAAARQCQRPEEEAREVLNEMETRLGYLERGGGLGRGAFWTLRSELHARLAGDGHTERDQRIDWETAKTRVLSVLRRRQERGKAGLSNAEIRRIARLDRHQVLRLLHELQEETPDLRVSNRGRSARWFLESLTPVR
jgi:ATP-dependent DNA helicase RecG